MADPRAAAPLATLALGGEFTIFTAAARKAQLLDAIASAAPADLEIDLTDVTELDTAGLQLMILAKREAVRAGTRVRFKGHSGPVLDVLDLCDLAGFFGDPVLLRTPT